MRVNVFKDALFSNPGKANNEFSGFDNFIDVIQSFFGLKPSADIVGPRALINTATLLPLALMINMPISLLFSYAIKKKCLFHNFFKVILFIPAITSAVVLCLVFNMALSSTYGFVPDVLAFIGIRAEGLMVHKETAWAMILIFSVWTGISTNMIYYLSSMSRIPDEIFESAKIDGASDFRQFFSVVIPMIWPTISTMMVNCIASLFSWSLPTLLLTQGKYETSTIGYVNLVFSKNRVNLGFVYALCVIVTIVGVILTITVKKLTERAWRDVSY